MAQVNIQIVGTPPGNADNVLGSSNVVVANYGINIYDNPNFLYNKGDLSIGRKLNAYDFINVFPFVGTVGNGVRILSQKMRNLQNIWSDTNVLRVNNTFLSNNMVVSFSQLGYNMNGGAYNLTNQNAREILVSFCFVNGGQNIEGIHTLRVIYPNRIYKFKGRITTFPKTISGANFIALKLIDAIGQNYIKDYSSGFGTGLPSDDMEYISAFPETNDAFPFVKILFLRNGVSNYPQNEIVDNKLSYLGRPVYYGQAIPLSHFQSGMVLYDATNMSVGQSVSFEIYIEGALSGNIYQ